MIAILGISSLSIAQITWDKAVADTARGFETTPDIETHNVITISKAGTYRWKRTYSPSCQIQTAICDKNSCYLETTDSADFDVTAGESFDMICHFYPYNTCCPEGATVTLYVFKVDEPEVNSTATYHLKLWCASSSVSELTKSAFKISPNPASNLVEITADGQVEVQFVNLLGETVQVNRVASNQYDVSTLAKGIYLVTVRNENETYTQRLVKN